MKLFPILFLPLVLTGILHLGSATTSQQQPQQAMVQTALATSIHPNLPYIPEPK